MRFYCEVIIQSKQTLPTISETKMTSTEYAEHRAVIKFCVNLGKTPTQTREMMEKSSIKPAVSRALVFKWHQRFKDGREDLRDDAG